MLTCLSFRLTISLRLMDEVICAITISPFHVEFSEEGWHPLTVLEIEGLAVKKGKFMGKGLGRLLIAYLRHIAHRLKIGTCSYCCMIHVFNL